MKKFPRAIAAILAITLLLGLSGCGASDGKTHLTFQIWDVAQRESMQAVCDAYTAKNPDVVVEVQVTSWNEYWTKLEAAAESNTMPDIFWMHTNQILYYSDFGMLADMTDLYDDVEPNYYQNHFSEISIGNAQGSDGRMYGVPKDNIFLVYNKEMFDAAGVAYPDAAGLDPEPGGELHRPGGGHGLFSRRVWADEPSIPPLHPGTPDSGPLPGGAPPGADQQLGGHHVRLRRGKAAGDCPERRPLGIELFVMDDGWFGRRNSDGAGLGDWTVNEEELPGGLPALVSRVKALGMKFGIWIEPEMVNEDSDLYREHPDWVLKIPGRAPARGRGQLVLDFSRKDIRDHVYRQIRDVLSSADVSYVKWDMNRSLSGVWSAALAPERQGEVYHRYVLGVYEMLEQMIRDFPRILIEGCCGGGGRFDAGMLYYTPQIWCSDDTDAVERLGIQYGTSFCYPPSAMGAHVSAVPNEQTNRVVSLETRGTAAMSGAFGYEMDLSKTTQEEREIIKRQVEAYKRWAHLIRHGDYYRLTSPLDGSPYTAWEHVSRDRREALVSLVAGNARTAPPFFVLRLQGLEPGLRYRVNGEGPFPGDVLMNAGYPLPAITQEYQSLQLHLEAE